MRITGRFLACAAVALFTACTGKDIHFRIVETSDVHGNLFSMDFMSSDTPERPGGLARVSTFLNEQRREYGKNLLYVDNGDLLKGDISVYYDRTADYDSISTPAAVLNYLGCVASNAGNNDIGTGFGSLDKYLISVNYPVLSSNLVFDNDADASVFPKYTLVERKGVRIAFVGLITTDLLKTHAHSNYEGLAVEDICTNAARVIARLRAEENPDAVIALVHSGLDDCLALATKVDGIDAILFGHDHEPYCDAVVNAGGDSIWLVNPGSDALQVACLDLDVSGKAGSRSLSIRASVQDVSGMPVDRKLLNRFSEKIAGVVHYTDSVIGILGQRLEVSEEPVPDSMSDFVHTIMRSAVSAQITLAQPQITHGVYEAGELTLRDLYRMFPRENTVSMVMLYGNEIKALLEYSAQKILDGEKEGFFTAQGVDYTMDMSAPYGGRISFTSDVDGKPFDEEKLYRVAIDSYFAAGGGGVLTDVAGITPSRLPEREAIATNADIRFYAITRFALATDTKTTVVPERKSTWRVNYAYLEKK